MSLAPILTGRLAVTRPRIAHGTASRTQEGTPASRIAVLAHQVTHQERASNGASPAQNGSGASSPEVAAIQTEKSTKAAEAQSAAENGRTHLIEKSRWADGIPPVMGAHLMASGAVAPISTSKGTGEGIEHLFYYPNQAQENYVVNQYVNGDAGAKGLGEIVNEIASTAIKNKGSFTLLLSGGSLLKALASLLDSPGADFSKWHVGYADERNVPHSAEDSNHKGAVDVFLSKANIPSSQVYAIKEGLPVNEAATEYEGQLLRISQSTLARNSEGWPVFDLILLGIGPDGHVASLFPNRQQTAAKEGWILPVSDSPKPPPERISVSLPLINSAANVAIVAFGKGKAEIVQRALEVQCLPGALPAQLVRPAQGTLRWMLDCEAASQLNVGKWDNTKAFPRSL